MQMVRRPASFLIVTMLASGAIYIGCAGPAPTPPPPPVSGLQTYVEGARAFDAGDDDRALILLQLAVKQNPQLLMARTRLGDLYRKRHDYYHAASQYEAAARLDPYSFRSHYNLAVAYQFLNRLEDAVVAYLSAIRLSPLDANSHMNLGLVYLALGHLTQAVDQLHQAIRLAPRSAPAWCNYGVGLEANGKVYAAEEAYRRSMELDPGQIVAYLNLAGNLIHQQRGKEAAIVLGVVVPRDDIALVRKRYGDALLIDHQDEAAMVQYDLALQRDPSYWPALDQEGIVLIDQYQKGLTLDENLRRQALALWQKSLTLQPAQPVVRQWIAQWNQNGRLIP